MARSALVLTDRFLAAMQMANEVHDGERRPGTEIPFVAHLLVVCGLVIEDGGDEDQAIAALLHDAVEGEGGAELLDAIARGFGARVAEIVAGCSSTVGPDGAERWIDSRRRYLEHLPGVQDDAILRVVLADKVHNARSIVRDIHAEGDALWPRFTRRTAAEQVAYYRGLLEFFERRRPGPLTEDLGQAVRELAELVGDVGDVEARRRNRR